MAKNKTGLHKKISSIFDGTPILKNNDTQEPPTTTLPESDYATAKPVVENDQETGAANNRLSANGKTSAGGKFRAGNKTPANRRVVAGRTMAQKS